MARRYCAYGVVLCLSVTGLHVIADDRITNLESTADQWIDLEINASKERSAWKSERVLLESTIRSLEMEQAFLNEEVASNQLAADLYTKNFENVATAISDKKSALDTLKERLQAYEARLKLLLPRLPEPLSRDIRPLVGKLGEKIDDHPVSVASRVQNVVTILTTIDQFNNSLTVTHQIRKTPDGGEFDTQVIYWGLAFGFAVDALGERSWRLSASDNGWRWEEDNEIATELVALIDIYERNREPELLTLPVSLAKGGAQ